MVHRQRHRFVSCHRYRGDGAVAVSNPCPRVPTSAFDNWTPAVRQPAWDASPASLA
jgi:hypothetical protein